MANSWPPKPALPGWVVGGGLGLVVARVLVTTARDGALGTRFESPGFVWMVAAGVLLIGLLAAGAYPRFTQGLALIGGIGAAGAAWMVAAGSPDRAFLAPLAAVSLAAGAVFLLGVSADRGHSRFG